MYWQWVRLLYEFRTKTRFTNFARFSLVSNHQTDVTSFDQFLKLTLFGFILVRVSFLLGWFGLVT